MMYLTLTNAVLAGGALAEIVTYTSDTSLMGSVSHFADFNELIHAQSLAGYQEDGLELDANRDYFSWDAQGFDGSEMYYADGGSLGLVDISIANGDDFNDLEMQISTGWSPDAVGIVYLWVQLFNDNTLVQEFNLDTVTGEYVGFIGGGFDQVLIGSYADAQTRDAHNPLGRNAIAIDNLRTGVVVPSPGSVSALFTIGLIATRRHRA